MGGSFIEIDGLLLLQCHATALAREAAHEVAIQVLPAADLADVEGSAAVLADLMQALSINPPTHEAETATTAGVEPLEGISGPELALGNEHELEVSEPVEQPAIAATLPAKRVRRQVNRDASTCGDAPAVLRRLAKLAANEYIMHEHSNKGEGY